MVSCENYKNSGNKPLIISDHMTKQLGLQFYSYIHIYNKAFYKDYIVYYHMLRRSFNIQNK